MRFNWRNTAMLNDLDWYRNLARRFSLYFPAFQRSMAFRYSERVSEINNTQWCYEIEFVARAPAQRMTNCSSRDTPSSSSSSSERVNKMWHMGTGKESKARGELKDRISSNIKSYRGAQNKEKCTQASRIWRTITAHKLIHGWSIVEIPIWLQSLLYSFTLQHSKAVLFVKAVLHAHAPALVNGYYCRLTCIKLTYKTTVVLHIKLRLEGLTIV